jgi:Asp-tRNA(Asn)/Glu-tRNA(Gln) amidotransferase A subunit family amidase
MRLLSRNGIIPASLTFDVPVPITRSDAAMMLDIMKGADAANPVRKRGEGITFDFQEALRKDT